VKERAGKRTLLASIQVNWAYFWSGVGGTLVPFLLDVKTIIRILEMSVICRSRMRRAFPFTAIVGQEEMKLALILNVVDPSIGGVLIMGHRGTGKSTAVRALADLLPVIKVIEGCTYKCDPSDPRNLCTECSARDALTSTTAPVSVVELPLGATEDRVCGTIDIERALKEGRKSFDPGLLARANRGFLYIDEVNLLEDHLVDLLLDVAATGRNRVEREGVSVEARNQLRLAATHAVRTSADVVRDMYDLAGGSAIYDNSPLQRRFRDAYTATAHFQVNEASRELPGRILLDQPADVSML